eukprot:scaffold1594_cov401-Prasinococcus_capsulatus_cf.AAC.63
MAKTSLLASLASGEGCCLTAERRTEASCVLRVLRLECAGGYLGDPSQCGQGSYASVSISSLPWSHLPLPTKSKQLLLTHSPKPTYSSTRTEANKPVYCRKAGVKWSPVTLNDVEPAGSLEARVCSSSPGPATLPSPQQRQAAAPAYSVMHKEVLAAAFAGCVLSCITFPLSSIKTQLMAGIPFGQIVSQFKALGFRRWYQGLSADLVVNLPYALLYMSVYEGLKAEGAARPVAAAAGAAAACLVTVPADIITQRAQVGLIKNPFSAAGKILKKRGIKGLYAGLPPALLRLVPHAAVQWTVYENVSVLVRQWNNGSEPAAWQNFMVGGIAGSAAALATQPLDVIKTRLHTGKGYAGLLHCTERIVKEEGFKAFMKGAVPRLVLVFPNSAIFYLTFQFARGALYGDQREEGSENANHTLDDNLVNALRSIGDAGNNSLRALAIQVMDLASKMEKGMKDNTFPVSANECVLSIST